MTEKEKLKAIAALKISAPVKTVTQEEFNDYIQTLNKVMDWLEQEPCEDTISRKHLLSEIDDLMKSPWFNRNKDDIGVLRHGYIERKEAVEIVRDLCIKTEPTVTQNQQFINKPCVSSGVCEHDKQKVLDKIKAEIEEHAKINYGLNTDRAKALCWCLNVIDKYKEGEGRSVCRRNLNETLFL